MSAVQYPFIDIAVHPRIRARLAAGDAIVIFSPDMKDALWANGRGAELFGHASIYDFLDNGAAPANVSLRQAQAAARPLKSVGESRPFTIRVSSGFQRTAVQAICELVEIGHDRAVLFAAPAAEGAMSVSECAARMIEGFDDADTHRAVLDQNGQVVAASPRFSSLELTPHTARMLINMVAGHGESPVKRPVPTRLGYLPAAMGKVSDTPLLHLLFIVETEAGGETIPVESREAETDVSATPVTIADVPVSQSREDYAAAIEAVADIAEQDDEPSEDPLFEPYSENTEPDATNGDDSAASLIEDEPQESPTETAGSEPVEISFKDEQPSAVDETAEQQPSFEEPAVNDAEVDQPQPVAVTPAATPVELRKTVDDAPAFIFNPDMRATRFVWKIDAEGSFSEVSSEFSRVVGPHAADINGLAFSDLASLFNFDPDGKITELLSRRDTWSGKTIWWPIEGTTLKVPVDLAALPTYTRSREFDGFRGFGIVRIADVVEDPLAIGLTLVPGAGPDAADSLSVEDVSAEVEQTITGPDDTRALLPQEPADDVVTDGDVASDVFEDQPAVTVEPEMTGNDEGVAADDQPETQQETAEQDETLSETAADDLPPPDEKPALRIVDTPSRRYSDKVIQFEGRRFRKDGLTPGEQAAFREIARRLDPHGNGGEAEENDTATVHANENVQIEADGGTDFEAIEPVNGDDVSRPLTDIPQAAEAEAHAAVDDQAEAESSPVEDTTPEANTDLTPDDVTSANDSQPEADDADPDAEAAYMADILPVRARLGLTADILDQMPVALLVHSGDTLIHGNPEFLRLTGYTSLAELDELGGLDALLQRDELDSKTADAGGMVVVRADDVLVPVSARLQSIRWEQSTALMLALMPAAASAEPPVQLVAPVEDEDGPAAAAEVSRLQVEVDELRSILETATDGVVIIGSEGDVRSMNRAASALFNYDNDETAGKPFVMLFAHESQKSIIDYLAGLSGHGVASVLNDGREVIGREAGGGFLPLFMTIGRLTSSNGYCAVIRDITQWKRTEEELRNAKRAAETANAHKSDFLAHVSHEIRTPLNAIIGFADMMATERFGPIGHPRYIEYANDIGRSGRHVLDIVNDLLDISKIEAGEMDLDFVAVGLNETVAEAVSIIQPQANGQRVIIRTALSQAVPQVVADLRSIKQIVLNILSNAIRFTPSGGQIVVSTAFEANGNVILRIRDTGIGMTRSELELAMQPFRQVTGAARKRGDGTGLGLPLTKAMVDANRAAFAISSAPNEGTLVEITFPSQRVLAN